MTMGKPPPQTPPSDAHRQSLLSASASGVKFLILLQLSSRLLTFVVNQILLRYLSPELLGISVQLELFMITVLYFSRESLRTALQRHSSLPTIAVTASEKKKKENNKITDEGALAEGTAAAQSQTVINLSLLTLPLGVIFSLLLALFYAGSFASSETASQPHFTASVGLYALATVIELASEPCFAIAQQKLLYKLRAGAEAAAAFTRCVVTCGVTIYGARIGAPLGPLSFAFGQIGYAGVLLAVYWFGIQASSKGEGWSLGLRKIGSKDYRLGYFNTSLSTLALSMWIQSSIKHVLTQGDSILISYLSSNHDQGIYALASNYGSLIARMLFQPLEESSRNLFAKLLSPSSSSSSSEKSPDPSSLTSAKTILKTITKLYLLLSIFAATLGPPFAPLALRIIAGSKWADSEAAQVLSSYCYYIPLLALNGITEAFVQSVATPAQLHRQSIWMFSFSLGFAVAGYVFVDTLAWGAQGLVAANIVNMALRIAWSSHFIAEYLKQNKNSFGFADVLPKASLVAAAVGVAAVARNTVGKVGLMSDICVGAALGIGLLLVCGGVEREFFGECWEMVRSGRER